MHDHHDTRRLTERIETIDSLLDVAESDIDKRDRYIDRLHDLLDRVARLIGERRLAAALAAIRWRPRGP
jgi:hypothetical protein